MKLNPLADYWLDEYMTSCLSHIRIWQVSPNSISTVIWLKVFYSFISTTSFLKETGPNKNCEFYKNYENYESCEYSQDLRTS